MKPTDHSRILRELAGENGYGAYAEGMVSHEKTFAQVFAEVEKTTPYPGFSSITSFIELRQKQLNRQLRGADFFGQGIPFFEYSIPCVASGLADPFNNEYSEAYKFRDYINFIEGDIFSPQCRERILQTFTTSIQGNPDIILCRPVGPFYLSEKEQDDITTVPHEKEKLYELLDFFFQILEPGGIIVTQYPEIYEENLIRFREFLNERNQGELYYKGQYDPNIVKISTVFVAVVMKTQQKNIREL